MLSESLYPDFSRWLPNDENTLAWGVFAVVNMIVGATPGVWLSFRFVRWEYGLTPGPIDDGRLVVAIIFIPVFGWVGAMSVLGGELTRRLHEAFPEGLVF